MRDALGQDKVQAEAVARILELEPLTILHRLRRRLILVDLGGDDDVPQLHVAVQRTGETDERDQVRMIATDEARRPLRGRHRPHLTDVGAYDANAGYAGIEYVIEQPLCGFGTHHREDANDLFPFF